MLDSKWVLERIGKIYMNTHALAMKGCHPNCLKILNLCNEMAEEYSIAEPEKQNDFLLFKRLHFQVRDKALTEENYLHFLAGYFGIIPTPEDLKPPEKGCFKIKEKEES